MGRILQPKRNTWVLQLGGWLHPRFLPPWWGVPRWQCDLGLWKDATWGALLHASVPPKTPVGEGGLMLTLFPDRIMRVVWSPSSPAPSPPSTRQGWSQGRSTLSPSWPWRNKPEALPPPTASQPVSQPDLRGAQQCPGLGPKNKVPSARALAPQGQGWNLQHSGAQTLQQQLLYAIFCPSLS